MVMEIVKMLKERGAVRFGDFTLASGKKSSYYIDIKSALLDPVLLRRIGDRIAEACTFDVVAGVAVGGIPIAVATALSSGRPYAIVRREPKTHGRADLVIGEVAGKRVLLVEDVTTSGGSVLYGVRALRESGARVEQVVSVVDREQGAAAMLEKEGIRLHPLVRASELLR
ncbi:MAG: orotate phosphoribosyltransferase [Methanomicrobiales archaeon]|nr:orotate phosphoribosyltransferase [Methanomicrobiales archaeon]MDI6876451.1 orotate phosphoribosyltransferase [Methanomicrobiales archaeon]